MTTRTQITPTGELTLLDELEPILDVTLAPEHERKWWESAFTVLRAQDLGEVFQNMVDRLYEHEEINHFMVCSCYFLRISPSLIASHRVATQQTVFS